MDHACAFAECGDANFFVIDFEVREGNLLHGVGSENGLGNLLKVVELRTQRRGERGENGDQLFRRQGDADDAGGRGENLLGRAIEDRGGGGAGDAGGDHAGLTSGAVGVAGVDGGHANTPATGAEMLFVHDQRRGDDAVGCEGGGGAGRRIGHDEGKVGAAALLEAGFDSAKAEAAGDEKLGGVRHIGSGRGHGRYPI